MQPELAREHRLEGNEIALSQLLRGKTVLTCV